MSGNMFIHAECRCSVDEAVRVLKARLSGKNIPLFAEFDHKLNAEGVGMDMPGATVLVFGNPALGTGLMLKAPSLALDLAIAHTGSGRRRRLPPVLPGCLRPGAGTWTG